MYLPGHQVCVNRAPEALIWVTEPEPTGAGPVDVDMQPLPATSPNRDNDVAPYSSADQPVPRGVEDMT